MDRSGQHWSGVYDQTVGEKIVPELHVVVLVLILEAHVLVLVLASWVLVLVLILEYMYLPLRQIVNLVLNVG